MAVDQILEVRESIGHVKMSHVGDTSEYPVYSDGDSESELLELFENGLSSEERRQILGDKNLSWPIRYHLSYERGNLLSWYKFSKQSRILEVGSGCGAITETLVKNIDSSIVSNELSHRRATINAMRNQSSKNLEIVVGNLQDYKPKELFDYVVCIGVLEYAGTFIDGENPYTSFLDHLHSFLKPGGKLLLAIENKFGLKYLSGAPEDHFGIPFTGISGYANDRKIQTFTKNGLEKLLNESGFNDCFFYYPHPDYKLPKIIFSDDYLPGKNASLPRGLLPTPTFDGPRRKYFAEQGAIRSIEECEIYAYLANSFLVESTS